MPLNDETRGIVGTRPLARMPRSLLVDHGARRARRHDALLARLDDGTPDGGRSTSCRSNRCCRHALARHPRVLLTPHASYYSTAAEAELRRKAALNIVQWATTGRPMYPVIQGTKIPA